jgi:hypothetical protein
VRILPGGDYGFAWTPHGTNAKDLEYFVKHVGMSTMEALLSATAWGGPMMKMGKQLGYIREGCLGRHPADRRRPARRHHDPAGQGAHPRGHEGRRVPPRAAVRAARTHALGRLKENAMADTLFTNVRILDGTGTSPTRQRARAGNRIRQVGRAARRSRRRRHRDRRRRRDADARHVRGAHALLVERRGDAGGDPDDAARGARAVVREGREALPRGGLDVVRRRRVREAAARRRDPQRDQRGPDPGPRYLAASQEITVLGGSATRRCRTCRSPSSASASTSAAPRRCARRCACSSSTASTRSS